ncbi:alpha-galactosidase [Dictyocaulus viviparus]|uniref:Alpha-galactosidase n=1 Tax=Dictyocaulus viviparus TaxID=29172 RepID=A0A0D8XQ76_DICVI|nr:alpha-galactosidase [Dictyocaulus viviparus]
MFFSGLVLFFTTATVYSLDNGLYRTPPMGWMSWTTFFCNVDCENFPNNCINEKLYREMADRLVGDGYLAAGYNRVHIDDCWMENARDEKGRLVADRKRFPNGIKNLSNYMHERNLELGIYSDVGTKTCAGYPGSMNYLKIDANTFAEWEVDYLKMDGCFANTSFMPIGYPKMQRSLNATGRRIGYGCGWPLFFYTAGLKDKIDYNAVKATCNTWRLFYDIEGSWKSISSIIRYMDENQDVLAATQTPGAWNDPDMLVIGLPGVTVDQAKVQMTLWSIWSSPLIMSNDLRILKSEFKEILMNKDVIAVDQDPLGIMGKLVRQSGWINVYVKPVIPVLNDTTSFVIAVVNLNESEYEEVQFSIESLGLKNEAGYEMRDLWRRENIGHVNSSYIHHVKLQPTSATLHKFTII